MPRRWLTPAVFALAGLVIFAGLGSLPLTEPDEGRNALVAAEMQAAGRWLVPTLGQADYLDKPAFYFDLVAASLSLVGRSEAAARLPSALAAMTLLGVVWGIAVRVYGARVAALSTLCLVTMPLFVAFARLVIFDMLLTLFVCAAILAGHLAEETDGRPRRLWYLAAAAAAGLATLVKGPVGFVVPALAHLGAALANGHRGALLRSFSPGNIAVFAAIVLPWFVALSLRAPDFPAYGIVHETLSRFTTPRFARNQPPWFYGMILGAGALPWSLLVPGGAVLAWRARTRLTALDRTCIVWSLVVVAFFSASRSKQPAYVLSVCIPLALLVARLVDAALAKPHGAAARQVWLVGGAIGAIAAAGAATATVLAIQPDLLARLPGPTDEGGALWRPVLPGVAGVCTAAFAAAALSRLRRNLAGAAACLALLLPSLLLAAAPAFTAYAAARSSQNLGERIPELPENALLACLRCFPSALAFEVGLPFTLVSDDGSELRSNYVRYTFERTGSLPAGIVAIGEARAWLAGLDRPVYLLADSEDRQTLGAIAAERGQEVTQLASNTWGVLLPPAVGR